MQYHLNYGIIIIQFIFGFEKISGILSHHFEFKTMRFSRKSRLKITKLTFVACWFRSGKTIEKNNRKNETNFKRKQIWMNSKMPRGVSKSQKSEKIGYNWTLIVTSWRFLSIKCILFALQENQCQILFGIYSKPTLALLTFKCLLEFCSIIIVSVIQNNRYLFVLANPYRWGIKH